MERAKRYVVVQTSDCFFIVSSYDIHAFQKVWGYVDQIAAFPTRKEARHYIQEKMNQGDTTLDLNGFAVYRDDSGKLRYMSVKDVQDLRLRWGWFPIEGRFESEREALTFIINCQSQDERPHLPYTS